jgi:hypothetical protein
MRATYSENKSENQCTSNGFRCIGWKRTHELHTDRAGIKNIVANVEVCVTEYRHRKGIKAYLRSTQEKTRRKRVYYLPIDTQMVVTTYQLRVDTATGNERCKSVAYRTAVVET